MRVATSAIKKKIGQIYYWMDRSYDVSFRARVFVQVWRKENFVREKERGSDGGKNIFIVENEDNKRAIKRGEDEIRDV